MPSKIDSLRPGNVIGALPQKKKVLSDFQVQQLLRAASSWTTQILCPTNAACNIYSNVTYVASYWPPWTVEEGDLASFFVQDLGLGLQ